MADHGCDELDRLMNDLRVQVPGATDPLLKMQLFNAIDRHLRRTNAWRYETDILLSQGVMEYPIFPPAHASLVRVMTVAQNGRPIAPFPGGGEAISQRGRLVADRFETDGDSFYSADEQIMEGAVLHYAVYWPNYVSLDVAPSADAVQYPLKAIIAMTLAPECQCKEDKDDACQWNLDPWMFDRYYDEWLWETLSRMQGMPNKPWSNPQLALFNGKRAYSRMSFSKQEAERGFIYDRPNWRFPRSGWP